MCPVDEEGVLQNGTGTLQGKEIHCILRNVSEKQWAQNRATALVTLG